MWIRLAILLIALPVCAEIIPSYRRTTWTSAGVAGGIPNVTTIYTNLPTSVTDTAFNAALSNCPSNQVVQLAAGIYGPFSGTPIQWENSGVVLRGAGMGQTVIRFGTMPGLTQLVIGQETISRTAPPAGQIKNWTAGYSQGATTITLDDVTGVPGVGHLLVLDQLNNNDWVNDDIGEGCSYCGRDSGERAQAQYVRIVSKSGNDITFEPGLHMWNYAATYDPEVFYWTEDDTMRCGIEELTITNNTASASGMAWYSIYISQAQNCWVKNVEFQSIIVAAVNTSQCKNIEVRGCSLLSAVASGSQSYGVVWYMASDSLMEDNICANITGAMNYAPQAQGNVVIYNYFTNLVYSNPNWDIAALASHDAHVCMNLTEGNWANKFYYDSIHGSCSHNTDLRNYYHGQQVGRTQNIMAYTAEDYCRSNNVVGNILGTVGVHTDYWDTNLTQYNDGDPPIYLLGVENAGGSPSFDVIVAPSTLIHGNWDAVNQAVTYDAGISDHDIPSSYYYSSKPTNFGILEWPPFDSADPTDVYQTNIPAGYRYAFGTNPPAESASSPLYFTNAVMRGKTLLRGKVVIR